ncbi:MAG: hypothetical protein AB3N13_10655 [Arenibacterium sp.]
MPKTEFDHRIHFDTERETMEVDFTGMNFDCSARVNAFYDRVEELILETGEPLWFFLVNLLDMRIDTSAWVAYTRRGKALNLAHSMGSVRFDASEITRKQIIRQANTDAFDPNLFDNRDEALARIAEMPSKRRTRIQHDRNYALEDYVRRIRFDDEAQVMDVDFSHFTFNHSRDVNEFYDHIESRIAATGRKWYFLVNLNGCRILPAAWVQYALRGKQLNKAHSLGSVRYAAGSETEADIRLRAETQNFDPNIRNTRKEALARLAEIGAPVLQNASG